MARLMFFTVLVVSAAVVIGCGPAKDLPDAIPRTTTPTNTEPAVPAASETAAKDVIEKAVKAYTGGKPELVAKGKASRVVLKGTVVYPGNQRLLVEASRTIAAVWPDQFHGRDEFQVLGEKKINEAWLSRPRLTMMFEGRQENVSNSQHEVNFVTDEIAQHWMALMLPLTDPKAIVFNLKSQTGLTPAGQPLPIQMLKLALPDHPVYTLTLDATTHAIVRVEYTVQDLGRPIRRMWTMIDHKVGPDGLLLPSKMALRWDNDVKEEWGTATWEFPATISEDEFSPPKK